MKCVRVVLFYLKENMCERAYITIRKRSNEQIINTRCILNRVEQNVLKDIKQPEKQKTRVNNKRK